MHHAVNDAMQHMPNAKMGYAFYCGKNKIHSLPRFKIEDLYGKPTAGNIQNGYNEHTRDYERYPT